MSDTVVAVDAPSASGTKKPQAPPVAGSSLESLALRGSAWTLAGYGAGQALRLVSNLILTRLLFPESFGLMALVHVFIQGLGLFSDIGIGPAIIQSNRGDDPVFLNTAWTIQVIRGMALWLCSCLIAYPVSLLYGEPMLMTMLPVMGITAAIAGLNSTAVRTMGRQLAVGRLTVMEFISQVVNLTILVGLALVFRSVWALVAGAVIGSLIYATMTHVLLPRRTHRLQLDREARTALFRFGRWILVSTALTFLSGQADRMIFGKVIPLASLGVYTIALTLATMPALVASKLSNAIAFPAYSRLSNSGRTLRPTFLRFRLCLLAAGAAPIIVLVAGGPSIVRLLYDVRYRDAEWLVQLLAIAAWFQMLECTNGAALLALGSPKYLAAGTGAKLISLVGLIPLGFHVYGFPGAVMGLVVSDVLKYAVSAVALHRHGLGTFGRDLLVTGGAGIAILAASGTALLLPGGRLTAVAHIGVCASVAALVCLPLICWPLFHRSESDEHGTQPAAGWAVRARPQR